MSSKSKAMRAAGAVDLQADRVLAPGREAGRLERREPPPVSRGTMIGGVVDRHCRTGVTSADTVTAQGALLTKVSVSRADPR